MKMHFKDKDDYLISKRAVPLNIKYGWYMSRENKRECKRIYIYTKKKHVEENAYANKYKFY